MKTIEEKRKELENLVTQYAVEDATNEMKEIEHGNLPYFIRKFDNEDILFVDDNRLTQDLSDTINKDVKDMYSSTFIQVIHELVNEYNHKILKKIPNDKKRGV